jgi:hypothetical protein
MNRFILSALIFLSLSLISFQSHADLGVGLILGQPTGLSAIYKPSKSLGYDLALAWSFSDHHESAYLHANRLWIQNGGLRLDSLVMDYYYGAGLRVITYDTHYRAHGIDDPDYLIGVRAPLGFSYQFKKPPIEIFGELALILNLIESTSVDLDGGIGIRIHF